MITTTTHCKQKTSKLTTFGLGLFIMVLMMMTIPMMSIAQSLLIQDFNFTGNLISNGWVGHSGVGTNPISTTAGLTYTGFTSSGIGNAALVKNLGGEDVNITFANQNTNGQSIYYSFMVNVNDAATSKTGDYFIHIGAPGGATWAAFAARVFVRIVSSNVNFGLSNTSTATYGTTNFTKNTTYLLVVKYTINAGAGNDATSLWVIPSGLPASEAAAGTAEVINTTTAGTDAINAIGLRQGSTTTSVQTVVDGIHVGTSWGSVIPTPVLNITGTTNHGTLCVGTPGTSIQYTINNTGFAAATGVTFNNTNTQFALNGTLPTSIPANGSAIFNVIFTPTSGGPQGSTITVNSTSPGTVTTPIVLSGNGTATVAPDVSSLAAAGITSIAADMNGSITTLGVCPATVERGFVYSQTSINNNPIVSGTGVTKQAVAGLATGAYGYGLTNLQTSTNYSYKAYVYDNAIYTYGALITFTTDAPPTSLITVNGTLSALTTVYGTPSSTTSFTVSGSNLTNNIEIEAPPGFELSSGGSYSSLITLTQTGGTVNTTTIDVRLSSIAPVGSYSGNITLSSDGSNNPVVATALSTVTPKPLTVSNAVANDKVYDGNNNATISGSLNGVINGDVVTFIGVGTFASVNVNVGPPITVTSTVSLLGGLNAGNYTLVQPTGLSANITKANQIITFNALAAKTYGNAPFVLTATSSSGLTVSYMSSIPSVATVSGNTVTIVGAGSTNITASQTGDGNYFPAMDVVQTLVVNKASQTITFAAITDKLINDPAFVLHAFTSVPGLIVTYMSSNGSVASVVDSTVTINGIGTTTITASQLGNANYLPAIDVLRTLNVIPTPLIAWQLFGKAGNETTINATTNDVNLNTSSLSRTGVNTSALSNTFSSTFYPVNETRASAISNGRGQRFTINAKPGYAVSLSTLNARFRRSSTGPNAFVWQYSTDGVNFTDIGSDISYTSTATNGDAQAQINLSGISAIQNVGSATTLTFRLIGWGATGTAGSFAIGRSVTNGLADYSLNIAGTIATVASIFTSAVSGSPFCVPAAQTVAVAIPFTSSGATFNGANTFTAQLSNATGSFAAPVSIGTLQTGSTSGTINAQLPAGLASGTAYRIRVVSDMPALIGSDNGTNLVVNAVTNPISISHSATQPLCFGGTNGSIDITVQGGQSPYSYNWSTNAVTEDISNINTGVYTVIVTDQFGCTKKDTTHVDQPTEIQISTVPTDATCAGASNGSINLTVSGGVGPYTYDWSSGDITEDITNQPANIYFINVADAHLCPAGSLDFINEPAPLVINTFTPSSGTSGTLVTITGSGLTPVTNVKFNTTSASFIVINDGEIDASVAVGTTTGPITLTALPGCTVVSAANFTINGGVTLNIKTFIEGLYAGASSMQSPLYNSDNSYPDPTNCDTLLIELHDATDPSILVYSSQSVLHINGNTSLTLPNGLLNGNYYIAIKTRNGIETWSKLPVAIGSSTTYDFTITGTP